MRHPTKTRIGFVVLSRNNVEEVPHFKETWWTKEYKGAEGV
jgi:hypothetical protein